VPGSGQRDRLQRLARRLLAFVERASSRKPTKRGRQVMLVVSSVVFVGAMVLGLEALPEGEHHLQWWAILTASVVGVPLLVSFNAIEYVATGRVLGKRIPMRDALPIAIYARAANLLPLPGAAIVSVQGLKREGASYGKAASATTTASLYWLAASLVVAGAAFAVDRWLLAVLFLLGGLVMTGASHVAVRAIVARRSDDPPPNEAIRLTALLMVVEITMILIRGLRFWLVMVGFDIGGSLQSAMVIAVAGVIASAIGFFPSGLGVREVLSGGLARLAGETAASGVLASGLDRVISLPVLAVISLVTAATHRHWGAGEPAEPEDEPVPA